MESITLLETMKVAITYDDGEVFQHFGRTEFFKVYEVKDEQIVGTGMIHSNGIAHGALVGLLRENGVEALICGGIGGGAKNMVESEGIKLYPGVSGNADGVAADFAAGKLKYNVHAECHDHGHDHGHDRGHECTCGKN